MNELPRKFYPKTWVTWTMILIFGFLACFSCVAVPLFWLDIAKAANGRPGHEAGIPLTVIGYGFMLPVFIVLAIKNDLVRLFADLAEMSKTSYFTKRSYFVAIGRLGGADHFFSPTQYFYQHDVPNGT